MGRAAAPPAHGLVAVTVTARASWQVADTLLAGRDADAQVWVPDSNLWVELLAAGGGGTEVASAGDVASTQVT